MTYKEGTIIRPKSRPHLRYIVATPKKSWNVQPGSVCFQKRKNSYQYYAAPAEEFLVDPPKDKSLKSVIEREVFKLSVGGGSHDSKRKT